MKAAVSFARFLLIVVYCLLPVVYSPRGLLQQFKTASCILKGLLYNDLELPDHMI